jgi:hypothetical protein
MSHVTVTVFIAIVRALAGELNADGNYESDVDHPAYMPNIQQIMTATGYDRRDISDVLATMELAGAVVAVNGEETDWVTRYTLDAEFFTTIQAMAQIADDLIYF